MLRFHQTRMPLIFPIIVLTLSKKVGRGWNGLTDHENQVPTEIMSFENTKQKIPFKNSAKIRRKRLSIGNFEVHS